MPVRLNGSTSGYTELDAGAVAGNNTIKMPTSNGSARQIMMGDGAGVLSFQWDAGSLFYRLNSDLAGANVTTAQSVFGVGVTLAASTVYAVEGLYVLTRSAGTTIHNMGFGFAGTATLNNILYETLGGYIVSATPSGAVLLASSGLGSLSNSTANVSLFTGFNASTLTFAVKLRGTVSINAGGTFIPQYTLSAAPGGAYSTVAGSYIKFTPIGAAGSASSQGTWS